MYHPTVGVPFEAVWEGVGYKGESAELVLDCYFFGYGCHRDSVGVPAKADEGAYGRACVASVLAVVEKKKAETLQIQTYAAMRAREYNRPGVGNLGTVPHSTHMEYLILSYTETSYLILAPSQTPSV